MRCCSIFLHRCNRAIQLPSVKSPNLPVFASFTLHTHHATLRCNSSASKRQQRDQRQNLGPCPSPRHSRPSQTHHHPFSSEAIALCPACGTSSCSDCLPADVNTDPLLLVYTPDSLRSASPPPRSPNSQGLPTAFTRSPPPGQQYQVLCVSLSGLPTLPVDSLCALALSASTVPSRAAGPCEGKSDRHRPSMLQAACSGLNFGLSQFAGEQN